MFVADPSLELQNVTDMTDSGYLQSSHLLSAASSFYVTHLDDPHRPSQPKAGLELAMMMILIIIIIIVTKHHF